MARLTSAEGPQTHVNKRLFCNRESTEPLFSRVPLRSRKKPYRPKQHRAVSLAAPYRIAQYSICILTRDSGLDTCIFDNNRIFVTAAEVLVVV